VHLNVVRCFGATVTSNGSPYAMGPLSVCPVCNVGVLWQTVGWIKMPLGTEIGLGIRDIVLDRDPAPPTERDTTTLLF